MRIIAAALLTSLFVVAMPSPAHAQAAPNCKGREVTILGTDGADNLRGTNARDVILALDGDDRIDGRGGNDVICGGAGRDLIKGGPGHDKLFGGADGRSATQISDDGALMVGDVVQGGPGDDLIDLGYDELQHTVGSAHRDRLSYKDSAFRVLVALGGATGRGHSQGDGQDVLISHPFLALLGSNFGDQLTGSTYGDEILGRGGPDRIDGGGGRDLLIDGIIGSPLGDDLLTGGIGRDTITSYGGHDRLIGDESADSLAVVHAPIGKVAIQGGPGSDIIALGGLRRDACVTVVGGGGTDLLLPVAAPQARRARIDVDLKRGAFGVHVGFEARSARTSTNGDVVGVRSGFEAVTSTKGNRDQTCGFIASVEELEMVNPYDGPGVRWHVLGSAADETVVLRDGGSVWASMAGGDDRVPASVGNDNLKGGPGDDRLYGDLGDDVANGGPGNDTCRQVEFRDKCELPVG